MTLFGTTQSGKEVRKIDLSCGDLRVSLLTLGAIVQDLRLAGVDRSLTLGSDQLADYEGAMRHHGSLIGPVANRISNARVRLDGMMYELERNVDGRIHLHSGAQAAHRQVWELVAASETSATLALDLPDGQCGLPGNRKITAEFTLSAPASLTMTVTGTTDTKTLMNFANHSYWNLDGSPSWAGHQLAIAAAHYLPCTDDLCPTGERRAVNGTPMDLREMREIAVGAPHADNNFCLSETIQPLRDVLWLRGQSGVNMTMATTEPGMQFYDGRDAQRPGQNNYEGVAFEAQHWPDAPNHPDFPSIVVDAGETYRQVTRWTFSNQ